MSIDSTHPEYDAILPLYDQMRDTYAGQRTVKLARQTYLAPTASMSIDGALNGIEPGYSTYNSYLTRASFPDQVQKAASTMVGLLSKDPWTIEIPEQMEDFLQNCTRKGESIWQLIRRVNEAQLVYGRTGLLLDTAPGADFPFFVTYDARSIINWSDKRDYSTSRDVLEFVVTQEQELRRSGLDGLDLFAWDSVDVNRALLLDGGVYTTFTEVEGDRTESITPTFNGRTLDFVPMTFIGANDLESTPGTIPLLSTSDTALSIYRQDADYKQTLHMQGQDTLVLIGVAEGTEGADEITRTGAGSVIELPEGGNAMFIGVDGSGIQEQRLALENAHNMAASDGARLLENTAAQAESGEALKVRIAAKTTTLMSIAITAATGIEQALKQAAEWMGIDGSEIAVIPNTDFVEDSFAPQEVLNLVQAKNEGLPMSYGSMHDLLTKKDITTKTFQTEIAEIAAETEILETIRQASVTTANANEQADRDAAAADKAMAADQAARDERDLDPNAGTKDAGSEVAGGGSKKKSEE